MFTMVPLQVYQRRHLWPNLNMCNIYYFKLDYKCYNNEDANLVKNRFNNEIR